MLSLPRIITPNQYSFIKDRNIHEAISFAFDGVNLLNKKCFSGNLAMKVDIRKAFDTLDWDFLLAVRRALGFNDIFTSWIDNNLHLFQFCSSWPMGKWVIFNVLVAFNKETPFRHYFSVLPRISLAAFYSLMLLIAI